MESGSLLTKRSSRYAGGVDMESVLWTHLGSVMCVDTLCDGSSAMGLVFGNRSHSLLMDLHSDFALVSMGS